LVIVALFSRAICAGIGVSVRWFVCEIRKMHVYLCQNTVVIYYGL
jgi:hypothetical protein